MDLPISCSHTPETMAAGRADLIPGVAQRAHSIEELQDGVRLRLPADEWMAVADMIALERQCCRFLRFDVTVEPDGGDISLSLTGPPGTREFLRGLIDG